MTQTAAGPTPEERAAFKRAELERWNDGECAERVQEAVAAFARELGQVRMTDEQVRSALDSLGKPGTLAESIVWAATNAFLDARALLDAGVPQE